MFGHLNIRRTPESIHQALSDHGVFSARLNRLLRDRFRRVLSADCRLLNRWPSGSVFSTGHRFPDLAGDDLGLRADYHLQNIATGTNNTTRAQGPESPLVE